MPPQVTCASALPGKRGNMKIAIAFFIRCISDALPEFNQSLLDFFNLFWLTTHTHAAKWLPKSCSRCIFSLGLCGGTDQEKRSRERCSSWTVLHTQSTSALSSKFPVSQGNAEALDRWGGKTKHRLISCFLSNTSAKNYCNRIVYVKIITSQRWDVFWDTVYRPNLS